MKVNIKQVNSVKYILDIEIPAKKVNKKQNEIYKRLSKTAKIKGFRVGKVPFSILKKYFSPQVLSETAEKIINETYFEAISKAKIEPISKPLFDFQPPEIDKDFVYKIEFEVRPSFEVLEQEYKGFTLKRPDLKVTEEDIDEKIKKIAEKQSILIPLETDRPIIPNDIVIIDYKSFFKENEKEINFEQNVEVTLGKGNIHKKIEDSLLNKKSEDIFKVEIENKDPQNKIKESDKKIIFEISVKEIKIRKTPEINDSFARSLGKDFKNVNQLKTFISSELKKINKHQEDVAINIQILDELHKIGKFDLPTSLVEEETEEMLQSFKQRLNQNNTEKELIDLDEKKLIEEFKPQAEKKVHTGIVLGQIANQEKVEISEKEIDEKLSQIATDTNQSISIIKEIYKKNNMVSKLKANLMQEKTLQLIRKDAKISIMDPIELAKEMEKKSF